MDKELIPTRTIQVYDNTEGKLIEVNTASTKWSEIMPLIEAQGFRLNNKRAILGSTKGVLELPDAIISPGTQTIFLVPSKMSSGAIKQVVKKASKIKAYDTLSYNELRNCYKAAREENPLLVSLGGNPEKQQLIDALENIYKIKGTKPKARVEKVTKIKEVAKANTPDLRERISSMENILGSLLEGLGEVLDKARGGRKEIKTIIHKLDIKDSYMEKEAPLKTKEELEREAKSLFK